MIRFQCPACLKQLKAADDGAGRKTSCPRCGQRLLVPPPFQTRNKTVLGQAIPDSAGLSSSSLAPDSRQAAGRESFKCPTCHAALYLAESEIGRMVDCPKCHTTFAALTDSAQPDHYADYGTETGQSSNWLSGLGLNQSRESIGASVTEQSTLQHSGLGIASFLIALVVGGVEIILALIVVRNMVMAKSVESLEVRFISGSLSLMCWNFFCLPACLLGAGMAVVAIITQKDRRHVFTVLGWVGNGIVILIVLGLIFLSMVKE